MTPFPKWVGVAGTGVVVILVVGWLYSKISRGEPVEITDIVAVLAAIGGAVGAWLSHSFTGTGGNPPTT